MAGMLVQQKVKDFGAWKDSFDSMADLRASKGVVSEQIFQDAMDPNMVTLLLLWNSMESAKIFGHSPELKAAMEKAGVIGLPTVNYLNEFN